MYIFTSHIYECSLFTDCSIANRFSYKLTILLNCDVRIFLHLGIYFMWYRGLMRHQETIENLKVQLKIKIVPPIFVQTSSHFCLKECLLFTRLPVIITTYSVVYWKCRKNVAPSFLQKQRLVRKGVASRQRYPYVPTITQTSCGGGFWRGLCCESSPRSLVLPFKTFGCYWRKCTWNTGVTTVFTFLLVKATSITAWSQRCYFPPRWYFRRMRSAY